ncbi:MAG: arginase [Ruminococcus sp.]|nr:arginase [Ruminococcus sp.]
MKTILIGAASDLGVSVDGANLGPESIIRNLNKDIKNIIINQNSNFKKSLDKNDLKKNLTELNNYNENLYHNILKYNKEYFPLTIGGDHSIAIPSILASCKKNENIGVIWVDAHPDFNTFETTITGNIHGLPLAAVANYHNEDLTFYHNGSFINPKNIVIIGARSIDKLELENLKDAGITYFTTKDLKEKGCQEIVTQALNIALKNTNKVHISFDLDIIDPLIATGVSVPEENGINLKEALTINELLLNNIDNIVSYDLVEYNPLKDKNNETLSIASTILNQVINKINEKDI